MEKTLRDELIATRKAQNIKRISDRQDLKDLIKDNTAVEYLFNINLDELSHGDKIILNGLITGAITAISQLASSPEITKEIVISSLIAGLFSLLIQLKGLTDETRPPKLGIII